MLAPPEISVIRHLRKILFVILFLAPDQILNAGEGLLFISSVPLTPKIRVGWSNLRTSSGLVVLSSLGHWDHLGESTRWVAPKLVGEPSSAENLWRRSPWGLSPFIPLWEPLWVGFGVSWWERRHSIHRFVFRAWRLLDLWCVHCGILE